MLLNISPHKKVLSPALCLQLVTDATQRNFYYFQIIKRDIAAQFIFATETRFLRGCRTPPRLLGAAATGASGAHLTRILNTAAADLDSHINKLESQWRANREIYGRARMQGREREQRLFFALACARRRAALSPLKNSAHAQTQPHNTQKGQRAKMHTRRKKDTQM